LYLLLIYSSVTPPKNSFISSVSYRPKICFITFLSYKLSKMVSKVSLIFYLSLIDN